MEKAKVDTQRRCNIRTGRLGEFTAAKYFKRNGYQIVEQNFRCKAGEIDLILKKHNVLVFVEVKTRQSLKFGYPSEAVTQDKIRHIRQTAMCYIQSNDLMYSGLDFRFDVMEILKNQGDTYINHLKGAF